MAAVFVDIDPLTHHFVDLFNQYMGNDPVLDEHDVSVNAGLDGSLVVYWAHKPNWRQRSRFKHLLRRARKALLKRDEHLTDADLAHLRLEAWLG